MFELHQANPTPINKYNVKVGAPLQIKLKFINTHRDNKYNASALYKLLPSYPTNVNPFCKSTPYAVKMYNF